MVRIYPLDAEKNLITEDVNESLLKKTLNNGENFDGKNPNSLIILAFFELEY